MEIVLFVLGSIGFTHIIVDSTIMQWLRDTFDKYLPEKVAKGIHCYQCTGWYTGSFCCWAVFPNVSLMQILVGGFASSFLANFLAVIMNYLEASTMINLPNEGK